MTLFILMLLCIQSIAIIALGVCVGVLNNKINNNSDHPSALSHICTDTNTKDGFCVPPGEWQAARISYYRRKQ